MKTGFMQTVNEHASILRNVSYLHRTDDYAGELRELVKELKYMNESIGKV